MGYNTTFDGRFALSRELTSTEERALVAFLEDDEFCQWRLSADRSGIEWDGEEKFYGYVEHAQRVASWFQDRGMAMTGRVAWHGESRKDHGVLLASDGLVAALPVHVAMSPAFLRDDIPAHELRQMLSAEKVPGWNKTWSLR